MIWFIFWGQDRIENTFWDNHTFTKYIRKTKGTKPSVQLRKSLLALVCYSDVPKSSYLIIDSAHYSFLWISFRFRISSKMDKHSQTFSLPCGRVTIATVINQPDLKLANLNSVQYRVLALIMFTIKVSDKTKMHLGKVYTYLHIRTVRL